VLEYERKKRIFYKFEDIENNIKHD